MARGLRYLVFLAKKSCFATFNGENAIADSRDAVFQGLVDYRVSVRRGEGRETVCSLPPFILSFPAPLTD